MGWKTDYMLRKVRREGIERQLFPTLSPDEQRVVDALTATNDLTINQLSVRANLPMPALSSLLFQLEMQGIVKSMAGGSYHLIR